MILEVRRIDRRCTIEGVMFSVGDFLVRIGRYFDRDPSDPSGLRFVEWTPPDDSSFVINATEIRGVNFTMEPDDEDLPAPVQVRRSGQHAAVVATPDAPTAKEFIMPQLIDDEIRGRCWC